MELEHQQSLVNPLFINPLSPALAANSLRPLSTSFPKWLVSRPTLLPADKSAATTYASPASYRTIKNSRTDCKLQIAMGWLATLFGGIYYATSGPKKPVAAATPPINASSSDEADFIKCANSAVNRERTLTDQKQEVYGRAGQEAVNGEAVIR